MKKGSSTAIIDVEEPHRTHCILTLSHIRPAGKWQRLGPRKLFLTRVRRIGFVDVDSRLDRCQVSDDEAAMLAAGLPVLSRQSRSRPRGDAAAGSLDPGRTRP